MEQTAKPVGGENVQDDDGVGPRRRRVRLPALIEIGNATCSQGREEETTVHIINTPTTEGRLAGARLDND